MIIVFDEIIEIKKISAELTKKGNSKERGPKGFREKGALEKIECWKNDTLKIEFLIIMGLDKKVSL